MYCIYDRVANVYQGVFTALNSGVAKRIVHGILINNQSDIARFPDDYDLYQIAVLDVRTGQVSPDLSYICALKFLFEEE